MFDYPELPWSRINDYLMDIGTERGIDGLLHKALKRLGDLVPFDRAGVLGYIRIPDNAFFLETIGSSEACDRAFQEYYRMLMPDLRINTDKFGATDWYDYNHTEYVTDFIRPQNIRHSAGIGQLTREGRGNISISINRSNDLPGFSQVELKIMEVIQGHLSNYVSLLSLGNKEERQPDADDIRSAFPVLTRREAEVAALFCRKYSAEMIGSRLLISPLTVYKHIENIYAKMHVNCRKELRAKIMGLDEWEGTSLPLISLC